MTLRSHAMLALCFASALSISAHAHAQYAANDSTDDSAEANSLQYNSQYNSQQLNSIDMSAEIPTANANFPIGPDATMTPGALCTSPTAYRYAEHIPYCNRNVDSGTKQDIIHQYDVTFGYRIESMDRQKFKIDHFIPLCAGGANSTDNLWPQNEAVYALTDPLEAIVCQKMSEGRLLQRDAIIYIRQAKGNLSQATAITAHVQSL